MATDNAPVCGPFNLSELHDALDEAAKGQWGGKDIAGLVLAIVGVIVTASIPVMLFCFQQTQEQASRNEQRRQQEQEEQARAWQEQQERDRQRALNLQAHERELAETDAMHVISQFQRKCGAGTRYAKAFRLRHNAAALANMGLFSLLTEEGLSKVNLARTKLQGIWDAIVADWRDGQLPEERASGRLLKRGISYLQLVEPLECANWCYKRDNNHGNTGEASN